MNRRVDEEGVWEVRTSERSKADTPATRAADAEVILNPLMIADQPRERIEREVSEIIDEVRWLNVEPKKEIESSFVE